MEVPVPICLVANEALRNAYDKAFAAAAKALSECTGSPSKEKAANARLALRTLSAAARNLPADDTAHQSSLCTEADYPSSAYKEEIKRVCQAITLP